MAFAFLLLVVLLGTPSILAYGLARLAAAPKNLHCNKCWHRSLQPRENRLQLPATAEFQADSKESHTSNKVLESINTVWDFSRPHTIYGSTLSIISLFLYAVPYTAWTSRGFFDAVSAALVPSLLMNLYITGLNQVTDIDIDKINKPYLPIASGKLSKSNGIAIVVASLIAALWLTLHSMWPLKIAVWGSCFLGTIYSLPPFRLKRFPLLAAFCILVVRGTLINMGFFLQAKAFVEPAIQSMSISSIVTRYPESIAVTTFFALFGLVIAIMKDTPDVEGDTQYGIKSFSVRMGATNMFRLSWNLLFGLIFGTSIGCLWKSNVFMIRNAATVVSKTKLMASGILGGFAFDLRKKAIKVLHQDNNKDTKEDLSKAIFSYYMYIWNIFYVCYMLLPFMK